MSTTATETDTLVASLEKNTTETIRVSWTTFSGKRLLDVRVWTVPAVPTGEGRPTKKGLTLRSDTWRELVAILTEALADENDC